ncbi:hypothetical protein GCM10028808_43520 [Spirosoma migulaei]
MAKFIRKEDFNYNPWLYFFVFSFVAVGYHLLNKYLFIDKSFYEQLLGNQLSTERVDQLIADQERWGWLIFIIIPFSYLIKFSFVTICLSLGLFLLNKPFQMGQVFKIVMLSELVFFTASIVKTFYFLFLHPDFTPLELQYFYPLSMLQLTNINTVTSYWLYPLQLANVFELGYILVLAYGLYKSDQLTSYSKSLEVTFASYIPALFLWIATVVFIQTL